MSAEKCRPTLVQTLGTPQKQARELTWEEWDFRSVPPEQLPLCHEYEFARSSEAAKKQVEGYRATFKNPTFEWCLARWEHPELMEDAASEAEDLAQWEFHYGSTYWFFGEFPKEPFLRIAKSRRAALARSKGDWSKIAWNFYELIKHERHVTRQHGEYAVPIDTDKPAGASAGAFVIDWARCDDELIRHFKDWLRAFRNKAIAIRDAKKGAGSEERQLRSELKSLGAWRLLKESNCWEDAFAQTQERIPKGLFSGHASVWKLRREHAERILRGNG